MKRLLLIGIAVFSIHTAVCDETRFYVEEENVLQEGDKFIVRSLKIFGIIQVLKHDDNGFFVYENETRVLNTKGVDYYYCRKCDQEFFSYKNFKRHVCKRNYYNNGGHHLYEARPSEFNRASEFGIH